jgi:Integrase core domain
LFKIVWRPHDKAIHICGFCDSLRYRLAFRCAAARRAATGRKAGRRRLRRELSPRQALRPGWRSLKHEDVYLQGYADGQEAKAGIGKWIDFYNHSRPHQALRNRTPMAVWRDGVASVLDENAVDMTLRLDNAHALPTCPQRLQQQQAA